jgi:hypothetical protein
MARLPAAAALALVFSLPLEAGVEVTASGQRVDVTAAEAPVSEVLDDLARKTRMKVVYEGPVPRNPVTLELRDRTPAQAVLGVLEGLGLSYALVLDASGTEVETLLIVGTGARAASAAPVRPVRGGRNVPRDAEPEAPMVEAEEPMEIEASVPAVLVEAPPAEEKAKAVPPPPGPLAASPPPGPLNPAIAFPRVSPFAPGPLPLVTPSPSPTPPSSN